MRERKIIKVQVPKVIWDADMSIFNRRPILETWMNSIREVVNQMNTKK